MCVHHILAAFKVQETRRVIIVSCTSMMKFDLWFQTSEVIFAEKFPKFSIYVMLWQKKKKKGGEWNKKCRFFSETFTKKAKSCVICYFFFSVDKK